ncbi:ABC transporter permease [Poseidonocella sp. HB161398]|uniref:ABC transporter permease n=1 Tax=Poseidonocella sp. HB161398 TaxID=2320855 RepID=UPI001108B1B6|nr:ABC transporter permease [Poseidonocella sp. HB161398]
MTDVSAPAPRDERVKDVSALHRMLVRPELGGICGTILVFALFFSIAGDSGMFSLQGVMNWTTVSAQFMIIAVGACLLMIAGEFDLSVGSMIGFAGMLMAVFSVQLGLPMWASLVFTFAICTAIGGLNGWLVIKTGLPSFIVTLASLYILRGATIWGAIYFTRQTIISGVGEKAQGDWLAWLFGGKILTGAFRWMGEQGWIEVFTRGNRAGQPVVDGIPMLVVWALGLAVFGHWLLTRTKFGNWIYASGGDRQAARYVGVPVTRVKILMFMFAAFCATVFAACQVMEFGSAAADRGLLKEFEAIICVVIGGALLTGGYGSVIGAALGAVIFGVVQQGLFFANAESSLFRVFLGVILLVAVIMNTYIRRIITGER